MERKPDYTYEQIIEYIKEIRECLWDFQENANYDKIAWAEKLCNEVIDPNFELDNQPRPFKEIRRSMMSNY